MEKYVNVDKALETLEMNNCAKCILDDKCKDCPIDHVIYWLRFKAQTVEEKPVVHAHWIEHTNVYECSKCGIVRAKGTMGIYNYCPHCGAIMDEEWNNEQS